MGFTLPAHRKNVRWEPMLDTREPTGRRRSRPYRGGQVYEMEARSLVVLRLRREDGDDNGGAADP
jgi:glycogen operon protein